ncbi:MAG: RT0821/Lpp0805 family surface protein [Gammaproteobacteria bacterium]|nr:RT0821/Lpp0805 family surface protein [Gammaproteobacteria bacterium]
MRISSLLIAAALLLSACETTHQDRGALLGAAAGGILGNQIGSGRGQAVATFAGAVAGAAIGQAVGARMDEVDRMKMGQANHNALEHSRAGEVTRWTNPDSGHSGSVAPVRTYQNAQGQYCREFQQTITVGGQTEQGHGTACRQPDGSWRIMGG